MKKEKSSEEKVVMEILRKKAQRKGIKSSMKEVKRKGLGEKARRHLAVRRDDRSAYVQYGDGSWECFDLAADATWRTRTDDTETVLAQTRAMLLWRSRHTDRTLADTMIDRGVHGRIPTPI